MWENKTKTCKFSSPKKKQTREIRLYLNLCVGKFVQRRIIIKLKMKTMRTHANQRTMTVNLNYSLRDDACMRMKCTSQSKSHKINTYTKRKMNNNINKNMSNCRDFALVQHKKTIIVRDNAYNFVLRSQLKLVLMSPNLTLLYQTSKFIIITLFVEDE